MPGMLDTVKANWPGDFREIRKPLIIKPCIAFSDLPEPITLSQLLNPDSRRNVRHVVLVPWIENLVVPGTFGSVAFPGVCADPMKAHNSHLLGIVSVVRSDHSSFSGGDIFGCIKAEGRDVTNRPHHRSTVFGRNRMGSILDQ